MVTRTYKCDKCGTFEKKTSIKEDPLRVCECGTELKRIFDKTEVLFCEVNRNRLNPINPQPDNKPIL